MELIKNEGTPPLIKKEVTNSNDQLLWIFFHGSLIPEQVIVELIKNEGTPPLIKKEGTHYFWAPPPAGHLRLG